MNITELYGMCFVLGCGTMTEMVARKPGPRACVTLTERGSKLSYGLLSML